MARYARLVNRPRPAEDGGHAIGDTRRSHQPAESSPRSSTSSKQPPHGAASAGAFSDVDASRASSIIEMARKGRGVDPHRPQGVLLRAVEGFDLFSCYGICVAPYASADDVEQCVAAAEKIEYPVVLKVDAESIIHKSDSGGVILDIPDSKTLREHAEKMLSRFAEASPKLLVQKQLPPGREVIVGAKAVDGLGHVVMFGLGGIFVEVLKDVSFRITPVSSHEAFDMIKSLQTYPLLSGVRGQAGVDLPALAETILRVSQMLADNPEIRELDINPVFAFERGAIAADARVFV